MNITKQIPLTRDVRAARKRSAEGIEGGDFYFSTLIQLVKNHQKIPDILLSLNFKTSSGTGLENARFTDASAYFFDVSFHKEYVNQPYQQQLFAFICTSRDFHLSDSYSSIFSK